MDKLYELSKSKDSSLNNKIEIGQWFIHYNNANIYTASNNGSSISILGEFIHIQKPSSDPAKIVKEISILESLDDVISYSKFLLGRFVVFYFDNFGTVKLIPDPTVTIPIYYMDNSGDTIVSSDSHYLKNKFNLKYSETSINIKNLAENQQPLPYNLTMFDEMKTVIPNHYFDSSRNEMIRFYPKHEIKKTKLMDAVSETIEIIDQIIPFLMKDNKLSLPLTAGIDSRTVLAFFKEYMDMIPSYTFHNDDNSVDLRVAKSLSEQFGFKHYSMKRKKLTTEQEKYFKEIMNGNHNINILRNGTTLENSPLFDHKFLAGDIIPLAKSNFGKNLPESLATASYFVTKTHNYSKENKKYVTKWLDDVQEFNYISSFDLFFWEYRFGRWLPNNANNYDVFAEPMYIFNCRYLIELWLSVTREERNKQSFHEEVIKIKWPELLDEPINPKNIFYEKLASNQYLFYIGSFVKYYLLKFKQ